jgi:hypothetical protein
VAGGTKVAEVPTITFTKNLRRHVDCPAAEVEGTTVAQCLAAYFETHPQVRSYVLDDQSRIRRHVAVFVGADQLRDPAAQSDAVEPSTEITVMQALSGG